MKFLLYKKFGETSSHQSKDKHLIYMWNNFKEESR